MTDSKPAQKYQSLYSLNPTNFNYSRPTSTTPNSNQLGVSNSSSYLIKNTPQMNSYQQGAPDSKAVKNQSSTTTYPSQKLTITTIDASQSLNPYDRKEPAKVSSKTLNSETGNNTYKTPTNDSSTQSFSFQRQSEATDKKYIPYQSYQSPSTAQANPLQSIKKDERNTQSLNVPYEQKKIDSQANKTSENPDTNQSRVPYKSRDVSIDQSQPISVTVSNNVTPKNVERGRPVQTQLQNILNADKRNNINSYASKTQNPYPLGYQAAFTIDYSKNFNPNPLLGGSTSKPKGQEVNAGISDSTDIISKKRVTLNQSVDQARFNPLNSSLMTAEYFSPLKSSSELRALHLIKSNEKMEKTKAILQETLEKQYAQVRQRTISPSHIRLPERSTIKTSARNTFLTREHLSPEASKLHQSTHGMISKTRRGRIDSNLIEDSYSKFERSSILQKRSVYHAETEAALVTNSTQLISPGRELVSPTRNIDDMSYSIVPLDFISYQIVEESYADGTRYEGEKILGKKHGRGNFFYNEGYKYEGNWQDDKMFGFGTLWVEDRRKIYEGEWEDNSFHGRGTMFNTELKRVVDFDGTDFTKLRGNWLKFEGLFEKGKKKGIGSLLLANGDVFVGNFLSDVVHGRGSYTSKKGATFAGLWQANKLVEKY